MLATGRLRERITLQRLQAKQDAFGGVVEDWADVATVWAAFEPVRGAEQFANVQTVGKLLVKFRLRPRSDVDNTMRVLFQGRAFELTAVLPSPDKSELVLTAVELENGQERG